MLTGSRPPSRTGWALLPTLLAVLGSAAGCGPSPACGEAGIADPDLASLHEVVFAPTCASASCHGGPTPEAGLDLSSPEAAHLALVGVATVTTSTARLRVAPGDPASSYLLVKLRGEGVEGNLYYPDATAMPPPAGGLCDDNVRAVEDWIAAGAPGAPG